jgi:hypothetical protein
MACGASSVKKDAQQTLFAVEISAMLCLPKHLANPLSCSTASLLTTRQRQFIR